MTRQEHLEWCKQRALVYCDIDDLTQAFASFTSDMEKHDETANHPFLEIGATQFFGGMLSTKHDMRSFINGFN